MGVACSCSSAPDSDHSPSWQFSCPSSLVSNPKWRLREKDLLLLWINCPDAAENGVIPRSVRWAPLKPLQLHFGLSFHRFQHNSSALPGTQRSRECLILEISCRAFSYITVIYQWQRGLKTLGARLVL